jgi:hypothetical protein
VAAKTTHRRRPEAVGVGGSTIGGDEEIAPGVGGDIGGESCVTVMFV